MYIYIIGIIVGLLLPLQTSINTNLGKSIKGTPFIASMVSFIIGTISLLIFSLIKHDSILLSLNYFRNYPHWMWLGGVFGVFGLTANIIIFKHLGAVQTVVMPILGQIIMGMIIDNFGLFQSPVHSFSIIRFISVLVVIIGTLLVVFRKKDSEYSSNNYVWQFIGIIAGMLQASQTSVNGYLGTVLKSSLHASLISFFVGAVILIIIAGIVDKGYTKVRNAISISTPWWVWTGGIIGALYVMTNAYINPIIGTGSVVIINLLGNLSGGIIFDKFGLMGTSKKKISYLQYFGIIMIVIGVILVQMF